MTPDEINRAIAKHVGWSWYAVEKAGWYYRQGGAGYTNRIEEAGRYTKEAAEAELCRGEPMGIVPIPSPDYFGDLNAIRWVVLNLPDKQKTRFVIALARLTVGAETFTFEHRFRCATHDAPTFCFAYLEAAGIKEEA